MRKFKAQMVTPWQVTSRRWKGVSTPKKVMDFAKKSNVPCGWYTDPYTRKRTPLVDSKGLERAWKYYKRTGEYWQGYNLKKTKTSRPRSKAPAWRRRQRKIVRMWTGSRQVRRKAA